MGEAWENEGLVAHPMAYIERGWKLTMWDLTGNSGLLGTMTFVGIGSTGIFGDWAFDYLLLKDLCVYLQSHLNLTLHPSCDGRPSFQSLCALPNLKAACSGEVG